MSACSTKNTAVALAKIRHRKVPGFDAYNAHEQVIKPSKIIQRRRQYGKKKRPKQKVTLACQKIIEPETGIHASLDQRDTVMFEPSLTGLFQSYEWANKIVQQDCGFLKLPYEVRFKIYKYAIAGMEIGTNDTPYAPKVQKQAHGFWANFTTTEHRISPYKNGKKFWSPGWCSDEDTNRLLLLCRQTYVDVAGGALFYRFNTFCFSSTNLMLNYLLVIKPYHMNSITSIELHFHLSPNKKSLEAKAFRVLAECKSLEHLTIKVFMSEEGLDYISNYWMYSGFDYSFPEETLAKIRDFKPLRALRGLASFNLCFCGTVPRNWKPNKDSVNKYRSVEEELRLLIVKGYERNAEVKIETLTVK